MLLACGRGLAFRRECLSRFLAFFSTLHALAASTHRLPSLSTRSPMHRISSHGVRFSAKQTSERHQLYGSSMRCPMETPGATHRTRASESGQCDSNFNLPRILHFRTDDQSESIRHATYMEPCGGCGCTTEETGGCCRSCAHLQASPSIGSFHGSTEELTTWGL